MKKFSITTLGCKVNQYESQAIREDFLRRDFQEADAPDDADICIVNTCTVTSRAERKSRNMLARIARASPKSKVYVAGCLAQEKGEAILEFPGVTAVLKKRQGGISFFEGHTRAFVKIEDGCENFCSYCIVPILRGAVRSRDKEAIRQEVERLLAKGYKEIVLSGICLGAYGKEMGGKDGLSSILEDLERLEGDFRIRLSSIEPMFVSEGLIEVMRRSNRICRHLHIPFQSGDDEILKGMNRRYTVADYEDLVGKLRCNFSDLSITTDIIVGFPGEREENFTNTIKFLKNILPLKVHLFPFSPRAKTAAFKLDRRVPSHIITERMLLLTRLVSSLSLEYRRRFEGRILRVLVEAARDNKTGLLQGYTDNYIKVLTNGPDEWMNSFRWVRIEGPMNSACLGKEAEAHSPKDEIGQMRGQKGR